MREYHFNPPCPRRIWGGCVKKLGFIPLIPLPHFPMSRFVHFCQNGCPAPEFSYPFSRYWRLGEVCMQRDRRRSHYRTKSFSLSPPDATNAPQKNHTNNQANDHAASTNDGEYEPHLLAPRTHQANDPPNARYEHDAPTTSTHRSNLPPQEDEEQSPL